MPHTLIITTLEASSGIAKDAVQNSWVAHHATASPTPGNTLPWTGPINNFYQDIAGNLSGRVSRANGGIKFKLYDISNALGGGNFGSPVAIDQGTLLTQPVAGQALPSEVACVLTLRGLFWAGAAVEAPDGADPGFAVDRPKSRRSGRLFIGPLNLNACEIDGRPKVAFRDQLRTAYLDSSADALAGGIRFQVWSRVDAACRAVTEVQTDDAFDTQRRRGVAPTARATTIIP